ncbi:tryptophan--tRNA ligase [Oscillatoria amoena NRMC-F 0135]|nr:tryptophan--tRNA ligase [Oscillatoria laete-virens]MDL5045798.1 tryptophan--tRNA ligase [Oscillatoria amoena NRMC-F 0135]MDL5055169.1 tryptophan--tRNA ligase [Oscillatoria laete-virens NRMC-F 0139]
MRILSGIQPSGILHLGNYFGMMRPSLELASRHEAYYFIANYHALTSHPTAPDLRKHTMDVAVDFLACGLDPARTTLFRQSDVPEHVELAWLLSQVTPMGLLERCHSYKDKTSRGIAANHGLFAYPVLMASDILIYQADAVPVGKDQKQHLEVTRDIAIKFNDQYGETFRVPEPVIQDDVAVIPGLDGQKMSKSYHNTIPIFGEEKDIRKKVMSIVTDSLRPEDPKDPDKSTIWQLYKLLASPEESGQFARAFREGGMGYGDAKKQLFARLWEYFAPARARREELLRDPARIENILREGADKARAIAAATLKSSRERVGL